VVLIKEMLHIDRLKTSLNKTCLILGSKKKKIRLDVIFKMIKSVIETSISILCIRFLIFSI